MNIKRHEEYIRIENENKPLVTLANKELRIIRKETPSIPRFFEVEAELKRRGVIQETLEKSINKMTGGNIIAEEN